MDSATVSRIEEWDTRPVAGGYRGLNDLVEAEFTGAVETAGTWLVMLNGRVVGVFGGTMAAFEGADATAYEAPHPALPLLFAMQEHDGEVRGQYYTDDTPIEEVDRTLSEGGFTGYLELSENILSGDYYVVYYGGRSLSAAFVGNEGRVETGDEAYDLATEEVGIYEVRAVDLDVLEVPEPEGDDAATGAATAAASAGPGEDDTDADEPDAPDSSSEDAPAEADSPSPDLAAIEEASEDPDPSSPEPTDALADTNLDSEPDDAGGSPSQSEPATTDSDSAVDADEAVIEEAESDPSAESAPEAGAETTGGEPTESDDSTAGEPASMGTESGAASTGAREAESIDVPSEQGEPEERFREEERWRETKTIPALDPEESAAVEVEPSGEDSEPERAEPRESPPQEQEQPPGPDVEALRGRIEELEAELEAREQERRRLAERVEELTDERGALQDERAQLEARIEELESELEAAQEAAAAGATGDASGGTSPSREALDRGTALDQTDLFVRYGSKGKATLEAAHAGSADREEVADNLRLETHSRFEPEEVSVDGRPFESFLADTIEYRFVSWLVEDLLYEIRETGSERGLRLLFDALPEIDRAEFGGTVSSLDEDDESREETFDVVCRDRMGQPLLVANINDSLDPATGDMMVDLVGDASAAGEDNETLAASFLVTASFFEPEALETASEATGGGFLSRDSKRSFVKLSRKGGYHLCLVEARGDDFHVAVPEM